MDVSEIVNELISKPNSYFCIQSECENANLRDVSELVEDIYDENYVMAIQQCVIGSYLDNAKKDPNILNNILTEILGSGSIISLDILGIPNTVLVKHGNPENKRLITDIYLGLYFINSLRREIPNFIYTYGYLICGAPSGSKLCSRKYREEIYGFACLLRAYFDYAKSRSDMFEKCDQYNGQIKLRFRPWWVDSKKKQPIHHFVWQIWTPHAYRIGMHKVLYASGKKQDVLADFN